jgi:hypothetical protein
MIDPGSLWVEIINGAAVGYRAPIYGYTVEEIQNDHVTKLNAFTPEQPKKTITATTDSFVLYSPGCEPWNYVQEGTSNTDVKIAATPSEPLWVAFEDEVRTMTSTTIDYSATAALIQSISGDPGSLATGIAYVVASKNDVDIEASPAVKIRATPFTMPGETLLGEVVATSADAGSSWSILERVSYRPGGKYDSSWIPISSTNATLSGRVVPKMDGEATRLYFNHNLGADLSFSDVNVDLYLGNYGTYTSTDIHPNVYRATTHSLWGADVRREIGLSGAFTKMTLTNLEVSSEDQREASVFYMDGRTIGIQFQDEILNAPLSGDASFDHLRLVIKRTS